MFKHLRICCSGAFRYLIPLLILIYTSGDIIDGKQARRTDTCTYLGEFLDHFFDIFVNGMLLAMLFITFEIQNPYYTAIYFF